MDIGVIGEGITKFGERWHESVESLAKEAAGEALEKAKTKITEIDYLWVGNMLLSQLENRAHAGALVAETLGYKGPAGLVEAACASGGLAVRQGVMTLKALVAKKVLVVGVEKMTDADSATITRVLMGAGSEEEQWAGATFPSLYALMHQAFQRKYKLTDEEIAKVPVMSHKMALTNPLAQFRKEITVDQVLRSALVADPIRQLHCAPITDGAAAVVLASDSGIKIHESRFNNPIVEIVGSGQGGDTLSLSKRASLTKLQATKDALNEAKFQISNLKFKIEDVSVAEVHDCFSVAQLMAVKDLELSDKTIINPSGGLKACGHPVGATGVKQIAVMSRLLRDKEGIGLTHNVGGSGATAVVHILKSTVDSKQQTGRQR